MTNPAIEIAALYAVATTVAYANITGNPAMSVPLWWNADGPSGSISSAATGTKQRCCDSPANSKPHDRGRAAVRRTASRK